MQVPTGSDQSFTDTKNNQTMNRFKSFMTRWRCDGVYRKKLVHTAILCWAMVGLGWSVGITGPSFPDLVQIIGEDIATSTWLFTVSSFGYLAGALIGGALYDWGNKLLILLTFTIGMSISSCLIPFCNRFTWMLIVKFCNGVSMSGLDTGSNAEILNVWNKEAGPYMQALHFAFSLGTLVAPLATEPFLARRISRCQPSYKTQSTIPPAETSTILLVNKNKSYIFGMDYTINLTNNNSIANTSEMEQTDHCKDVYEDTNVHFAFIILAAVVLISSVGIFYLFCKSYAAYSPKNEKYKKHAAENDKGRHKKTKLSNSIKIILLACISIHLATYCLIEDGYSSFLVTFTLNYLNWSKSVGSFATSLFWTSFAMGRFCGIFIISCCDKTRILTAYLTIVSMSLLGFFVSVLYNLEPLIWVFIASLGFFMSIIWPTVMNWTSDNVVRVSGRIASVIMVTSSLSALFYPLSIGYLMEYNDPLWFVYILGITLFVSILMFFTAQIIYRFHFKKIKKTII